MPPNQLDLEGQSDHDLLVRVVMTCEGFKYDIMEIKRHKEELNSNFADHIANFHRLEGAVGLLKWFGTFTLAALTVAATLAGIALAAAG